MGLDPLEEVILPLGPHLRALHGKLVLPEVPEMPTKTVIQHSTPVSSSLGAPVDTVTSPFEEIERNPYPGK